MAGYGNSPRSIQEPEEGRTQQEALDGKSCTASADDSAERSRDRRAISRRRLPTRCLRFLTGRQPTSASVPMLAAAYTKTTPNQYLQITTRSSTILPSKGG